MSNSRHSRRAVGLALALGGSGILVAGLTAGTPAAETPNAATPGRGTPGAGTPGAGTPGTGTPTGASPVAGTMAAVTIVGFRFTPQVVTVTAGTTVTWTNDDIVRHNVTADDGAFASASLAAGDTFAFTFTTPGTYAYVCTLHPGMTGRVVAA